MSGFAWRSGENTLTQGTARRPFPPYRRLLRGGVLTAPCAWQMVGMILEGGVTDFRGIGLVEVLWKAISGIINCQILSSIQFHDALHGFFAGRVTGTATLEAKLLQQIIAMRDTALYSIFLDLRNTYDALYRDR